MSTNKKGGGSKSTSKLGVATTTIATASSSQIHHITPEDTPSWMNRERTRILTFDHGITKPNISNLDSKKKMEDHTPFCVYYWMQRDVRAVDNWALHYAEFVAQKYHVPLRVVYTLPPPPPPQSSTLKQSKIKNPHDIPPKVYEDMNLTHRHGMFLIDGLKYVSNELAKSHTPLDILFPSSRDNVGNCLYQHVVVGNNNNNSMKAIAVICDMSPLRHFRTWTEIQTVPLLASQSIPLIQVDAHNIIPVWYASDKREVGARTLRPRIHRHLEVFLTHFPSFQGNQHVVSKNVSSSSSSSDIMEQLSLSNQQHDTTFWKQCIDYLVLDTSIPLPSQYQAGTLAAMKQFTSFTDQGLKTFDTQRNDPNISNVCSNLSPWINYGHVSFQRLALEIRALKKYPNGTATYLEEGIVRRELSDNFCFYTKDHYDELTAAAGWAVDTLRVHETDPREYVYTLDEFERGATHDELWNAAQLQVVREGKMHGFMRMYWAKKILEWTPSPDIALRTAQYLNDRYALDGNDPNGFTGVGWSIMGIHDMGWTERKIFGKIRFMNYDGCKRKFKIATYVAKYPGAMENSIQATKGKRTIGTKRKTSS